MSVGERNANNPARYVSKNRKNEPVLTSAFLAWQVRYLHERVVDSGACHSRTMLKEKRRGGEIERKEERKTDGHSDRQANRKKEIQREGKKERKDIQKEGKK